MGSKQRFDVAMYLSNYIVFKWDSKKKFPKEYLDLLKRELGIEWNLT